MSDAALLKTVIKGTGAAPVACEAAHLFLRYAR
jgi:hypothetical protein